MNQQQLKQIFLEKMLRKLGASRHRQVGGRDLSIPFSYYQEASKEHIFELMEEVYELSKRDTLVDMKVIFRNNYPHYNSFEEIADVYELEEIVKDILLYEQKQLSTNKPDTE